VLENFTYDIFKKLDPVICRGILGSITLGLYPVIEKGGGMVKDVTM
jgi:hypothetical protein